MDTITCNEAARRIRANLGFAAHAPLMAELVTQLEDCKAHDDCVGVEVLSLSLEIDRRQHEDVILALLN